VFAQCCSDSIIVIVIADNTFTIDVGIKEMFIHY